MQPPRTVYQVGDRLHVSADGIGAGRAVVTYANDNERMVSTMVVAKGTIAGVEFMIRFFDHDYSDSLYMTTRPDFIRFPSSGSQVDLRYKYYEVHHILEMSEQEWLTCTEPHLLVHHLRFQGRDRKLRLGACARSMWHDFREEYQRRVVEVAERHADGEADADELAQAFAAATVRGLGYPSHVAEKSAFWAAITAVAVCYYRDGKGRVFDHTSEKTPAGQRAMEWTRKHRLAILRDLFGSPFQPVTLVPEWLTPGLTDLARSIYAERDFDRLPILADALEEAGCTHEDLLSRCRGKGLHFRGCWALDAVLGQE